MGQLREIMQTTQIMEKSTKSTSHKIEIASFILGVIGLIWSAFIINTCAIAFIYLSDIQDVIRNAKEYYIENFTNVKNEASNVWCSQLDFISLWLREVLIAICLLSSCQFIANLQLMFGIKERKASFVKWWLVVKFIEIFLVFWLFLFELSLFIYESDVEKSINGTALSWILVSFFLFILLNIFLWNMVSKVHKNFKEEDNVEKSLNRRFAYSLHYDDIEIAKAKGKYMKF